MSFDEEVTSGPVVGAGGSWDSELLQEATGHLEGMEGSEQGPSVSFQSGGLAVERGGPPQSINDNSQTAPRFQRGKGWVPSFSPVSDPAPRLTYIPGQPQAQPAVRSVLPSGGGGEEDQSYGSGMRVVGRAGGVAREWAVGAVCLELAEALWRVKGGGATGSPQIVPLSKRHNFGAFPFVPLCRPPCSTGPGTEQVLGSKALTGSRCCYTLPSAFL